MVSTHLKNVSQIGSLVKTKKWNHHPIKYTHIPRVYTSTFLYKQFTIQKICSSNFWWIKIKNSPKLFYTNCSNQKKSLKHPTGPNPNQALFSYSAGVNVSSSHSQHGKPAHDSTSWSWCIHIKGLFDGLKVYGTRMSRWKLVRIHG